MLNHIKNLGIHVTPEDKQRWNTAAEKSSGKDIDIDEYSTTEEVKQLIKDYVDNQGFITDIPEYYETEEEVLLLLNTTLGNYTRSEDLDETLAQYTTLAALNEFEQAIYDYLQQFKQDILEDTKYVTAMQFSDVSRDLTLTQSDGTTLSVNIPGGGGGSSVSAYLMMEAIAYCNVSSDVTPVTPEGGSYNFNTYILTPPHDPTIGSTVVWANSQNGMTVDSTHSIYISKRVFSSDPDAPSTSWSQPILYSGSIQTETTNVNVYSTEVAKVFTVYCEGTVQKITDPVSGEISYKSVPPSNVSHAPEGGTYDRANDALSSNPHTYGVPNEYWTPNRPTIPSTWTDPDTEQSEDPVTFSKSCYFSIGTVKSDNSLEWSTPSVYGIDYVIQASNLKFIAIDYSVLAEHISLSTDDLAVVAENVDLKTEQLAVIAQYVSIDAPFTKFRGSVSATEFAVVKDNTYYTIVDDNVVKNTDIDQTLFSISQNTNQGYDPTSPATDVVLNIWNPGQLEGHERGTEDQGNGQKGTLTGNEIEYTINPKRIAQSAQTTFQHRARTYECYTINATETTPARTEDDWNYFNIEDSLIQAARYATGATTDNFSNHECGTFTLPDPQRYAGTTISVSVYPSTRGSSDAMSTGVGDEITVAVENVVTHSRQYDLNSKFYNHNLTLSEDADKVSVMWASLITNAATKPYAGRDYDDTINIDIDEYLLPRNIGYDETLYDDLINLFPQIKIDQNSVWQFVKVVPCDEHTADTIRATSDSSFSIDGIGIISLDTDTYDNIRTLREKLTAGGFDNINDFKDLVHGLNNMSTYAVAGAGQTDHINNIISRIADGTSIHENANTRIERTINNASSRVCILPTYSGFDRLCENKPLTFTAVAKKIKNPCAWEDRTVNKFTPAEFYYWEIQSTDFAPVVVSSGIWQAAYTPASSASLDVVVGKVSYPVLNNDHTISDKTLYQCGTTARNAFEQVLEQSEEMSKPIVDVLPFTQVLATLGYIRTTMLGDNDTAYHNNTGLYYNDQMSKVAKASVQNYININN